MFHSFLNQLAMSCELCSESFFVHVYTKCVICITIRHKFHSQNSISVYETNQ